MLALTFLWLLVPGWLVARAKTTPAKADLDSEYVPALAAADRFLHAWQSQNQEDGLMMLTDEAKRHSSEEGLQKFFSPAQNSAYQITGGKKLKAGRYAFPVELLETSDGMKGHLRRRFSEIIVLRTGRQDWAVDRLP